ncbi:MAG: ADP-ribosylglycohydrolase family protein [bacterium]
MLSGKSLRSRFAGCLLGLALGDSLGAPFEGMPGGEYSYSCENPLIYTDDTEMMINLTESILSSRAVDPEDIAQAFVKGYTKGRGYGRGTVRALSLIKEGMSINEAARSIFPDGSCGNGAAMRVAPIGLLYWWNSGFILDAAEKSSIPTHIHPLGIEGAKIMALAVGFTIKGITREALPGSLIDNVNEELYRKKLSVIRDLLREDANAGEVAHRLGNGVFAHESVPAALYAFIRFGNDYKKTIEFCFSLGGDIDTIAAMAGALSGAYVSEDCLPGECIQKLEDADRIKYLSFQLFEFSNALKTKHIEAKAI